MIHMKTMAHAQPLAILGAVCVRHTINISVLMVQSDSPPDPIRTMTVDWEGFLRLPNPRNIAAFTAPRLFMELDAHYRTGCKCHNQTLFGINPNKNQHLPELSNEIEHLPPVPYNSPIEGIHGPLFPNIFESSSAFVDDVKWHSAGQGH